MSFNICWYSLKIAINYSRNMYEWFFIHGQVQFFGRVHLKVQRGSRHIAVLFSLTSALDGRLVVNATPRPLYPGKEPRYPLYRRLGGPQGQCGRVRNILPPPGFDPWTIQPVASRYTDCAIQANLLVNILIYLHRMFIRLSNRIE
jgi:hypothetical protein